MRKGIAVKFAPYSSFYPVQETGVILFGSNFLEKDRAKAGKFMIAFLRAVRFYDGALQGAHLTGPGAKDVWDALSEITQQPDKTIFRDMVAPWSNPDGAIDMPSLVKDLAYFRASGDVTADIKPEQVVDTSFVTQALKESRALSRDALAQDRLSDAPGRSRGRGGTRRPARASSVPACCGSGRRSAARRR